MWARTATAAVLLLVSACAGVTADNVAAEHSPRVTATAAAPTSAPPPTAIPSTTTTTAAIAGTGPQRQVADGPATAAIPAPRTVYEQAWTPFATVGGVVLRHPSARVERVGFHQSNHDGARQLEPLASAAAPITLETRDRDTGSRTAADVVLDPEAEIRAPVTGRVRRAGTYVLYCDYSDDFAVIEPDDHPGWEVKILHIDGVLVRAGDRVEAGSTVLAPRPTPLPFESQIDEFTAAPPWPHVHIEVVDPAIPDRPSGHGC